MYLLMVTGANLVLAALAFLLFKKVGSSSKIVLPTFEPIEQAQAALNTLRSKISITNFDLDEPIFTGKMKSESANASLVDTGSASAPPAPEAGDGAAPQEGGGES